MVSFVDDEVYRIQTLQEPRRVGLGFGRGSSTSAGLPEKVLALCDDQAVCDIGLVSRETMGFDWAALLSRVVQGDSSIPEMTLAAAWRAIKAALLD